MSVRDGLREHTRYRGRGKADLNVIDFGGLYLHPPETTHDLPVGGRLVQRTEGCRATIVNGQTVYANGKATGALPGRLVRSVG